MPARIHALLVVRPDGRVAADIQLTRTLTALRAQSRPVDALTIVLCDAEGEVRAVAERFPDAHVISAPRHTGFAEALGLASTHLDGDAVWLLEQGLAPAPGALTRLDAALETAPSVAFAVPKLVRADENDRIVSLGVSLTRYGRTVGLADGEVDQGQLDMRDDVLGGDVRGILVRADSWRLLDGLDPALAGADEGLDLGVRARLAGGRVVLAPGAIIAVGDAARAPLGVAYARRTAQLHRRLVYAPAPAVILHWLSLLPLALFRTLTALLGKQPGLILPEWGAAATVMARPQRVSHARANIRRTRRASWAQLAPLRVTATQLRQRLHDDLPADEGRGELRFFSGGGGWVVLAALVVSIAAFFSLLAWPVLSGGALAPLRTTIGTLWEDALSGVRALGWDTRGPADPFSAVIALLGTLSPAAPSRALVVLWVLALPLATLGGWFAATRFSGRASVRIVVAVAWALAPSLLDALITGRPTVVIAHLVLPWLLWSAAVAHRSWTSAAVASIAAVFVLACAPSLTAALGVLWIIALLLTLVLLRGAGLARVLWLAIPSAVIFAPLAWQRLQEGQPWALLADPGVPLADPGPHDLGRRMLLVLGFPSGNGWAGLGGDVLGTWAPFLVAPLLLLALAAPIVGRSVPAALLMITALAGFATAVFAIGVAVASSAQVIITLWPGAALSLYWLALVCAAAVTLDAFSGARRWSWARPIAGIAVGVALAVSALPALTSLARGTATIAEGTSSTLPAYVEAEGRSDLSTATLVLTPSGDGAVVTDVVWGDTAALGGQSTLRSARTMPHGGDLVTANLAAQLVSAPDGDAVADLAAHGVAFVLLDGTADASAAAEALRIQAENALDQRDQLEIVGDTARGKLWRVTSEITPRAAHLGGAEWRNIVLQGGVLAIALLLAMPTRLSLEEARRRPRTVGGPRRTGAKLAPRATRRGKKARAAKSDTTAGGAE